MQTSHFNLSGQEDNETNTFGSCLQAHKEKEGDWKEPTTSKSCLIKQITFHMEMISFMNKEQQVSSALVIARLSAQFPLIL